MALQSRYLCFKPNYNPLLTTLKVIFFIDGKGVWRSEFITISTSLIGWSKGFSNWWNFLSNILFISVSQWLGISLDTRIKLVIIVLNIVSSVSFSLSVINRKESSYTDFLCFHIFWLISSEIMLPIVSLSIYDASIFFGWS